MSFPRRRRLNPGHGQCQSYSAAAALEWRGYATVRALSILHANSA